MMKTTIHTLSLLLFAALMGLTSIDARAQEVVELTPDDFAEKVYDFRTGGPWQYRGDKPAIVDFYTPWCIHCKMLRPRLNRLAKEYGEQIIIYTINGDSAPNLARQLGIRAYPTLLFIPMREIPTMSVGALPEKELKKGVETILLKNTSK